MSNYVDTVIESPEQILERSNLNLLFKDLKASTDVIGTLAL